MVQDLTDERIGSGQIGGAESRLVDLSSSLVGPTLPFYRRFGEVAPTEDLPNANQHGDQLSPHSTQCDFTVSCVSGRSHAKGTFTDCQGAHSTSRVT